jgi:hypothetical protein
VNVPTMMPLPVVVLMLSSAAAMGTHECVASSKTTM